jgi:hypothetical protein
VRRETLPPSAYESTPTMRAVTYAQHGDASVLRHRGSALTVADPSDMWWS